MMIKRMILWVAALGVFSGKPCQATTIKIGCYNTKAITSASQGASDSQKWLNRRDYVAKTISDYAYDIIGINEMREEWMLPDISERLTGYSHVGYSDLKDYLPLQNPIFFRSDKMTVEESGRLFLTAHDLTVPEISWDNSTANRRMLTWAKVRVMATGEMFFFFVTHLDHEGNTARNEQASICMRKIREIAGGYPAILVGDHNCTTNRYPVYNLFSAYMKDCYSSTTTRYGVTGGAGTLNHHDMNGVEFWDPTYKSSSRIDIMWVKGATVTEYRMIDDDFGRGEMPSDHFAIQATIELDTYTSVHSYYVNPAAIDDGDGSRYSPYNHLQQALDAASSGDTIRMAVGCQTLSAQKSTFNIKKSVTIIGGYNTSFDTVTGYTELSGDINGDDCYADYTLSHISENAFRVVTIAQGCAVELLNLDIHGGNAASISYSNGGGVYCLGARLVLDNCRIHDNHATGNGAGVYATQQLNISNSVLFQNVADTYGAAYYTETSTNVLWWRSTVKGNYMYDNCAMSGAAGYNNSFSWLLLSCNTYYNNYVSNSGIVCIVNANRDCHVTLVNNTFAGNSAVANITSSRLLDSKGCSAVFLNIAGTTTDGNVASLVNNTIVGNSAAYTEASSSSYTSGFKGAAVQVASSGPVYLYNNIIAGNTSPASTGGDVYLASPDQRTSQYNVYSTEANMNITKTSRDLVMATFNEANEALTAMLGGEVVNGKFVPPLTMVGKLAIIRPVSNTYGAGFINKVPATAFNETYFQGDVDDNAWIYDTLTTDQLGNARNMDGTGTRGAIEYVDPTGMKVLRDLHGEMSENSDDDVYDLNGRKMQTDMYRLPILPKGVYIIRGKKYVKR